MKLLIIDDDTDLLNLAKIRLSRSGIETFTAQDLTTARLILANHHDLSGIICDLFLASGENGMDFFESEISSTFQGKFILVSGAEQADPRIARHHTHPRYRCFLKPYSFKDVLNYMTTGT